jgi:hypothetical protein
MVRFSRTTLLAEAGISKPGRITVSNSSCTAGIIIYVTSSTKQILDSMNLFLWEDYQKRPNQIIINCILTPTETRNYKLTPNLISHKKSPH